MKIDITLRRVAAFTLPGLCWALVASTTACGDDDDTVEGTAGKGGSSAGKNSGGTAGKSAAGSSTGGTDTGGQPGAGSDGGGTTPVGGEGGAPVEPGGAGAGGVDGGAGGEGGAPVVEAVAQIFNISPTGHDRFFGDTFDAAGNLYAVGQITSSNDSTADVATVVAKFKPNGELDTTFAAGGYYVRNVVNGTNGELFRNIVVQSTGKIVIAGTIEHIAVGADARDRDAALVRINADGTKDTTFGVDGVLKLDLSTGIINPKAVTPDKNEFREVYSTDSGWGLARYPDDRLVVEAGAVRTGGLDTNFVILRLSADGARDQSFGTNGQVEVDTKVTVAGEEVSNNASPRNVTILPGTDGIIGAGYQPKNQGDTSPVVFKITDAGVLDPTFATNGIFQTILLAEQTEAYSAVVQPDATGNGYHLVTTGYGRELDTEASDIISLRLTSGGVLDTTYGDAGIAQIDIGGFADNSRNLLVLPDRRVVLAGGGRLTSGNVDGFVTVLTPDGAPDTTVGPDGWKKFDLGGVADFLWGVALSPDNKTLGFVGLKSPGNPPSPVSAADDAAVLWLPVP